jgi:hypothetical protein
VTRRGLDMRSLTRPAALKWAASIAGYALGIVYLTLITNGRLEPGIDLGAYLRAGLDLRAGHAVYVGQIGDATNFPYAPTWAVIAAAASFLPGPLLQAGLMVLDVAAVRYVCGSWRAAGYVFAWPLTAFVMTSGNVDILIAAAIVMAWREHAGPLVLMSLAKLAPALALPPYRWKQIAVAGAICFAVTLPWWHLWPEWVAYLLRQPALISISIPIPWYVRLPFALAFLAWLRRPWAAALAAVVAMPSLYLSTSVILIAPIRLFLDERIRARSGGGARGVAPLADDAAALDVDLADGAEHVRQ